jgi:uncharacterized protein YecE (DUF72 family)
MPKRDRAVLIGTAAWSLPSATREAFPEGDSLLARYAGVFPCTEVNSTFSKTHRPETFARWAAQTPPAFRFAVKLPKAMTHDSRLKVPSREVGAFVASLQGLGDRLGVLLVQLPPSLALEPRVARAFFRALRKAFDGPVVCEPRHASWFTEAGDRLLVEERVGRVAADPAKPAGAGEPGRWLGEHGDGRGAVVYYRWHGAPRMYWSAYAQEWLRAKVPVLREWPAGTQVWCVFDNTASGAATADALVMRTLLGQDGAV